MLRRCYPSLQRAAAAAAAVPSASTLNVIVRHPSPSMNKCELVLRDRQPIDVAKVEAEHRRYVSMFHREVALPTAHSSSGITVRLSTNVVCLPPLADFPDSVFVEDTCVILPQLGGAAAVSAVLTRPGAASRRGEVAYIRPAVDMLVSASRSRDPSKSGTVHHLVVEDPDATVDGGVGAMDSFLAPSRVHADDPVVLAALSVTLFAICTALYAHLIHRVMLFGGADVVGASSAATFGARRGAPAPRSSQRQHHDDNESATPPPASRARDDTGMGAATASFSRGVSELYIANDDDESGTGCGCPGAAPVAAALPPSRVAAGQRRIAHSARSGGA
jgi:hypothetical protein